MVQVGGAGRIGGRDIITISVGGVERLEGLGVEVGGGSSMKERVEGVGEDGHATHLCSTVVTSFQFPLILQQREQANKNIATNILPTLCTNLRAGDIAMVMQLISDLLFI